MVRFTPSSPMWTIQGGLLFVSRPNGVSAHRLLPAPFDLVPYLDEMQRLAGLPARPRLAAVERIDGTAVHMPGLIAYGVEDTRILADSLWAQMVTPVSHYQAFRLRYLGRPVWEKPDFIRLVRVIILAHEYGHELDRQGFPTPYRHPEMRADYFAGVLVAHLELSSDVARQLFWDLGCNQVLCSHPPSPARMQAFDQGVAEALRNWRRAS